MNGINDPLVDQIDGRRASAPRPTDRTRLPVLLTSAPAAEEPVVPHRPRQKRSSALSAVVLRDSIRIADAVLLILAAPLLVRAALPTILRRTAAHPDVLLCILAGLTATLLLGASRQFHQPAVPRPSRVLCVAMLAQLAGCLAVLCLAPLLRPWPDGTLEALGLWLLSGAALLAALHVLLVPPLNKWTATGHLAPKVGIVGINDASYRFIEHARRHSGDALHLVGVYSEHAVAHTALHAGLVVRGQIDDLIREIRHGWIDTVVVALPAAATAHAAPICRRLESCAADVHVLPDLAGLSLQGKSPLATAPLMTVAERPLKDWKAARKRVFDIILGSLLLLLLTPLFLLVALLIRCESGGPVLFSQRRVGFNNVEFTIYKFRTMYHDAADPDCNRQTARNDRRVTVVGRWLRRLSIDELPQLLNVLKGDMSLVGPRPHSPNTRAGALLLDAVVERYGHRHRIRPGITGWAQVNGLRGEIRDAEQIRNRVEHDLYYIENCSVLFDMRILGRTAMKEVFSGRAY